MSADTLSLSLAPGSREGRTPVMTQSRFTLLGWLLLEAPEENPSSGSKESSPQLTPSASKTQRGENEAEKTECWILNILEEILALARQQKNRVR